MEAESNRGFHNEDINSSMSRHAISFQHGAMNNSMSEMVPMGNYFGFSSSSGMVYSGNSTFMNNNNHVVSQGGAGGNSAGSSSLLVDSVPGLKHDTGLAVEWSLDEQYRLEEGLAK
jgi:hypothetical protein